VIATAEDLDVRDVGEREEVDSESILWPDLIILRIQSTMGSLTGDRGRSVLPLKESDYL
jgi:hypothetical protein